VRHCNSAIEDPLMGRVLPIFNEAISFCCHVMASFHIGIIIIVLDRVSKVTQAQDHVSCIHHEMTAQDGHSYFHFSWQWNHRMHNNSHTHPSEFKEGKLNAFPDGVAYLGTPACVAIHTRKMVMPIRRRWYGIIISFCI
jgi:hypothetical protein